MTIPRTSVLMPVRDGTAFLEEALHSILRQTDGDFELLAIDDGSTDDTPSILARHAALDRRIRVIRTPPCGIVAALNLGLAEARGRYVARMDADDVAAPGRLARQITLLDATPTIAVVASGWRVIDPVGSVRRTIRPPASPGELRAELGRRNCLAHASVTFRRDVVREIGGYRPAFRLAEDYDLWLRLSERCGIMAVPDLLLDHREHPGQSTVSALEQRILSEIGVHAAAARRRRRGMADGMDGARPVDRETLAALGVTAAALRDGIVSRALGAGVDAARAGHRQAAGAAIDLARRQGGLTFRTRLHLAWLALRIRA